MDEESPRPLAEGHDPTHSHRTVHSHRAAWVCLEEFDHLQHFFISVRPMETTKQDLLFSCQRHTSPVQERKTLQNLRVCGDKKP